MSARDPDAPTRASELSKVPSWILLGFTLGALFVLLFKVKQSKALPPASSIELVTPTPTPEISARKKVDPALTSIEAVWAVYGEKAVWEGNVTEVAMWNAETLDYRDFFEVVRRGEQVYFRSIPRLTRPVLDRGLGPTALLRFTAPAPPGGHR